MKVIGIVEGGNAVCIYCIIDMLEDNQIIVVEDSSAGFMTDGSLAALSGSFIKDATDDLVMMERIDSMLEDYDICKLIVESYKPQLILLGTIILIRLMYIYSLVYC
ncbi:hypothetical protein [Lysinibacillus xylanilyticus]|uniref:hypothetical protein n=1 Tax=Lysinibacillus xylanilyticus TaxID=582475 RepID=UPI0036D84590